MGLGFTLTHFLSECWDDHDHVPLPPSVAPSSTKPPIDGRNLPEKPRMRVQHGTARPNGFAHLKHQKLDGTGLSEHDDSMIYLKRFILANFPKIFKQPQAHEGPHPSHPGGCRLCMVVVGLVGNHRKRPQVCHVLSKTQPQLSSGFCSLKKTSASP